MTGRELFQEIGNISEEYVVEAEKYQNRRGIGIYVLKNPAFRKTLVTAACLVVCAGLVFTVQKLGVRKDAEKESVMENQMVMESSRVEMFADTDEMAAEEEKLKEEKQVEYKQEDEAGPETEASEVKETADKKDELKAESALEEAEEEMQSENGPESVIGEAVKNSDETESTVIWDAASAKKKMASYPDKYEEILELDGIFILVHGKAEKGQTLWEAFLKSVDAGESAQAEIVRFTVEGDPIIETVFYDGKAFYLCVDNSRDAYRGKGDAYFEARYSSLVKTETDPETGGKTIEYILTDGEKEYSIVYIEE